MKERIESRRAEVRSGTPLAQRPAAQLNPIHAQIDTAKQRTVSGRMADEHRSTQVARARKVEEQQQELEVRFPPQPTLLSRLAPAGRRERGVQARGGSGGTGKGSAVSFPWGTLSHRVTLPVTCARPSGSETAPSRRWIPSTDRSATRKQCSLRPTVQARARALVSRT